jgi:hypothetical protein
MTFSPALSGSSPGCSTRQRAHACSDVSPEYFHATLYQAAPLMRHYAGAIEAWEVGAEVGNVKNNRPELMEQVGLH